MTGAQDFYTLAVSGTDQTRQLSREEIFAELASGALTPEHWVWVPDAADWKQISEIPALQTPVYKPTFAPIAKTPPAAPVRVETAPVVISSAPVVAPRVEAAPAVAKITVKQPSGLGAATPPASVAKVTVNPSPARAATPVIAPALVPPLPVMAPVASGAPKLGAVPIAKKMTPPPGAVIEPVVAHTAKKEISRKKKIVVAPKNLTVEHEDGGHPYIRLFFGLIYAALAAAIAANYLLVDKPLGEALAHGSYVLVPTHAHLGSLVQPGALVIHVLPNSELREDNLAEYLQTLAKATPGQPIRGVPFDMVGLTSSWKSQYVFTGMDWTALGKMTEASPNADRDFIADHILTVAGQPIIRHANERAPADLQAERDRVWQQIVANFTSKA